ncbi:uncharacterized protein BYT42DRAFT_500942 [Radiomyces spectabilis]|uniref:uncharacterized protein n=1 Tax=Radiomyces spectabilis TaxID=64574 RepID=UPI0022200587|nr:uncharacterized protein BYT42DRAFT_500942 [Radiomyces spectabilis]KAI8373052.1 hypothetical protein BYT42DRAFT_500942 [Radiomyces spectabilis]
MYGRKGRLSSIASLVTEPKTYGSEEWMDYLNKYLPVLHGQAVERIKAAQERQRKFYNNGRTVNGCTSQEN